MSEKADTSLDDEGEQRIIVRRQASSHSVTSRQIIRAVQAALDGRPARSISVAIVDDASMAALHERYLGDDRPTDVLAFDLREDPAAGAIDGEIVVSAETAARAATRLKVDAGEELLRYAIHGTLHLAGFNDHTPAGRRRMRAEENRILASFSRVGGARRVRTRKRRVSSGG